MEKSTSDENHEARTQTRNCKEGDRRNESFGSAGDGAPAASGEDAPYAGERQTPDIAATTNSNLDEAQRAKLALAEFLGEGAASITPSQKTTSGGEDYLKVHLYLNHGDFPSLSRRLNEAQEAAVLEKVGQDEIQLGEFRFIVQPGGIREGDSKKGLRLRWRLLGENGIWLYLGIREQAHRTQANAAVEIRSLPLMQFGTKAAWGMVEHVLDSIGATIIGNKVSRVDACVDLTGIPYEAFATPFRAGHFVTRGHHRSEHSVELPIAEYHHASKCTGFTVGKSPMLVRVYDKRWESKKSPEKLELLKANRWGGDVAEATRVEIQLGRERLKTYGVDSLDDWFEKRAAICKVVMEKWLRLTDGPVERKHANRTATLPQWVRATDAFAWCESPDDVDLTPLAKIEMDMSRRYSTALGIFANSFARSGKQLEDNEHFMREARAALLDAIGERDMAEVVRRKALERAAA